MENPQIATDFHSRKAMRDIRSLAIDSIEIVSLPDSESVESPIPLVQHKALEGLNSMPEALEL